MINFSFIIPDTNAFQSGGNLYNARLIEGLKKEGIPTQEIEIERLQNLQKSTAYFVDSLYLKNVEQLSFLEHKYLIVHHLESLFPQKAEDGSTIFEQIERPLLNQFDGFLVTSLYTQKYLLSKGLHQPIYCIPPGLDYSFSKSKRNFEKVHAVMVANFIKRKGILPFLEQVKVKEVNGLTLSFLGNIEMEKDYAAKCLDLIDQLEGVKYLGELPQHKVFEVYEQSNLFISTAFMETYGMAIQEAKQAGLALLLLDGGNVKNHLDTNTKGWCFKTMDEIVDQLQLLTKQPSLLRLEQFKAEHYTWKHAAQYLVHLFKNQ